MAWLRDIKSLQTSTILNYNAALKAPLVEVLKLDLYFWDFREMCSSLFLEKPKNSPRVPAWSLHKVLELLSSGIYVQYPQDKFAQL